MKIKNQILLKYFLALSCIIAYAKPQVAGVCPDGTEAPCIKVVEEIRLNEVLAQFQKEIDSLSLTEDSSVIASLSLDENKENPIIQKLNDIVLASKDYIQTHAIVVVSVVGVFVISGVTKQVTLITNKVPTGGPAEFVHKAIIFPYELLENGTKGTLDFLGKLKNVVSIFKIVRPSVSEPVQQEGNVVPEPVSSVAVVNDSVQSVVQSVDKATDTIDALANNAHTFMEFIQNLVEAIPGETPPEKIIVDITEMLKTGAIAAQVVTKQVDNNVDSVGDVIEDLLNLLGKK